MLHLFYAYSGIVARLVPHIIKHLQLDPAHVLIVNDRNQSSASTTGGVVAIPANFLVFVTTVTPTPHPRA